MIRNHFHDLWQGDWLQHAHFCNVGMLIKNGDITNGNQDFENVALNFSFFLLAFSFFGSSYFDGGHRALVIVVICS